MRRTTVECGRLGVRELTLYCLSSENWKRPEHELEFLMHLLEQYLIEERQTLIRENIRLEVIGRREPLPDQLRAAVEASSGISREDGVLDVTVALAYSGRDELVEAAQATVRDLVAQGVPADELAGRLTGEALASHLYTRGSSDPDLIIRTSGEVRLSGFLPWQSVYSEYYFCEAYWPAFREIDFLRAIRTYQQRARRFGQ